VQLKLISGCSVVPKLISVVVGDSVVVGLSPGIDVVGLYPGFDVVGS